MSQCPVGVWFMELRAIILSATVHSPTVNLQCAKEGTHVFDAKYRYVFVV